MAVFGFILVIAAVIATTVIAFKAKKEFKENPLSQIGETGYDRFYVECILADCTDFSDSIQAKKADLLCQKYIPRAKAADMNFVRSCFEKAMKQHYQMHENKVKESREKEKEKLAKAFTANNRYASLKGIDKPKRMLNDMIAEFQSIEEKQSRMANMAIDMTQEREYNWAAMGGLASGIAGIGAGIVTAADYQLENARIRATNAQRMEAATPMITNYLNASVDATKSIRDCQEKLASFNGKLICDESPEKILENLNIDAYLEVLMDGAFQVVATVEMKKDFVLGNKYPAYADGTLTAHVYDGDKKIGFANLVLPLYGTKSKATVVGTCLSGAKHDVDYKISFTAEKMWLVEK
ncbi:MAG: hypothetical protein IJF20_00360 [Clostridia bacterium]|nr:hypothetical protein [Clostridia bacterium]